MHRKSKLASWKALAASLPALALHGATFAEAEPTENEILFGFRNTPVLPGTPWRVHDPDRPTPPAVQAGANTFSTPTDAIVLFDGKDANAFVSIDDLRPDWLIDGGTFSAPPRAEVSQWRSVRSRASFGDVQLHLEFRTPRPVNGKGQMRGNSGVLFMGLYEIQILDSWNNTTYADGMMGAIYGQYPPLANASLPPGEWQSLDIIFQRPRFSLGGKLKRPGYFTVFFNGVLVQNHQEIMGATAWRKLPQYSQHPDILPLVLQDHGCEVAFRNIWARSLEEVAIPASGPGKFNTDMSRGS